MSTATKDPNASRRRGLPYANDSPGMRSSTLSLVSNATGTSNKSKGSMSTVTQDAQPRSKPHGERKKKSRKRTDHDHKTELYDNDTVGDTKAEDVFTFLVGKTKPGRENHEDKTGPEMQMRRPSSISQPTTVTKSQDEEHSQLQIGIALSPVLPPANTELVPYMEPEDMEGYYRTQLSDSGISMGSSTSESQLEPITKHSLSPLIEEAPILSPRIEFSTEPSAHSPCVEFSTEAPILSPRIEYTTEAPTHSPQVEYSTYVPTSADSHGYHHEQQHWVPYPPTIYTPEPMPMSPTSTRNYPVPQEYPYHGTPEPPSTGESSVICLESTPLIFRDKANKIPPHPQVFRSFAKVNARMLLQMQSNIADLEHELALLDNKMIRTDSSNRHRRTDHGHSSKQFARDQSRRADLYQDLHTSLEQYHQSLSTFHQINQITYPCKPEEPAKFKSWLMSHVSPPIRVASLVGDGSDLIRLGHAPNELSSEAYQIIAYNIVTNIFFPLLLFKFTSSVLTRLILLSLTTTAAVLVMDRHRAHSNSVFGNTHWHCVAGSTGVSLLAALLC